MSDIQLVVQRANRVVRTAGSWMRTFGVACAPPVLRVALALPFLRSGMTRWEAPFQLSFATPIMFEEIFKLHLFGHEVGMPFPDQTAYIVAVAEIVLPTFLILGLATRPAALGLLIMTGVIQLTVPEGWANFHLYWASIALAILALGPGPLSLDALFSWLFRKAGLVQSPVVMTPATEDK